MARAPVGAPRRVPPPLRLLTSGVLPEDQAEGTDESRWELGFEFERESCGDAETFDPCAPGSFTPERNTAQIEYEPFGVRAGESCSAFGFSQRDYEGRARRLLEACESKQIANEFWTGDLATERAWPNRFLADTDSDVVTDGPTAVIDVLACLEQGLAECACGTRGMIHATPQLVTHWAALGNSVLRREGGLLLTIHDTIVVTDAGYDGSGPSGQAAGASQWAYATGLVTVRRSPIIITPGDISQALTRTVNTIEYTAQRLAAVTWDGCCHLAAQADLEVCLIGGVS